MTDSPRGPLEPAPRSWSSRSGRRNVDAYQRALNIKTGMWALVGALMGALVAGIPGAVVGFLLIFVAVRLIVDGAGGVARRLHAPSGSSTPRAKEHSRAEALLVRGHVEEAVEAFREAVAEDPTDPGPYLRLARIHRDELDDAEEAVRWFRGVIRESQAPKGLRFLALRELVELCVERMEEPGRAAPELARCAEEWEGTEEGGWARRELASVKAAMRSEDG